MYRALVGTDLVLPVFPAQLPQVKGYRKVLLLLPQTRYTSRPMTAFVIRRLIFTLPVVWIVVTLVFSLIHLVPGDPVAQMLGEGASVTEVQRLTHEFGLDRPILAQYW